MPEEVIIESDELPDEPDINEFPDAEENPELDVPELETEESL